VVVDLWLAVRENTPAAQTESFYTATRLKSQGSAIEKLQTFYSMSTHLYKSLQATQKRLHKAELEGVFNRPKVSVTALHITEKKDKGQRLCTVQHFSLLR